jgi:hypothetical protein
MWLVALDTPLVVARMVVCFNRSVAVRLPERLHADQRRAEHWFRCVECEGNAYRAAPARRTCAHHAKYTHACANYDPHSQPLADALANALANAITDGFTHPQTQRDA